MVTRDQELWALALWVEKHHGGSGAKFIAGKLAQLEEQGETGGVKMWRQVWRRYADLAGE